MRVNNRQYIAPSSLDIRRRRVLLGLGGTLVVGGGLSVGQSTGQKPEVTVSIDNQGATAWEVTDIEGEEDVAPTGQANPVLTLRVGTRYTFENGGWDFHPLAFRDADDEPLLSQSDSGQFEDDEQANWSDDGETVAFTLTPDLADTLDDYVCTVHSSMNGQIEIDQTQEGPAASVSFTDQSTDGTTVSVASARLDDGGFVTIHDETLLDGDALGSVVGVSEYLESGPVDSLTVPLDEELSEDQTLIAMPHRDTNDNQTYDFVDTEGSADGPYTSDEGAVTDAAEVTVESSPEATVSFADQSTDGTSVTVQSVEMENGGFVTVHDETLLDGDALGSVVGVSEYLEPGSVDSLTVELDDELTEDQTLIAMPHRDTNNNQTYDFVDTEGSEDGPYTNDDGAVTDSAEVTVETEGTGSEDGSEDESMNENETGDTDRDETGDTDRDESGGTDGDETGDESSDGSGPGFGPMAGLAGLGGLASYVYKRLQRDGETIAGADEHRDN
jgi:hypothetical protein